MLSKHIKHVSCHSYGSGTEAAGPGYAPFQTQNCTHFTYQTQIKNKKPQFKEIISKMFIHPSTDTIRKNYLNINSIVNTWRVARMMRVMYDRTPMHKTVVCHPSAFTAPLRDPSQCLLSRATNLNFSSFTNPYKQPFTSMTMTTVMTTE